MIKLLRNLLIAFVVTGLLLVVGIWALVTQPFVSSVAVDTRVLADTDALRTHVEVLTEQLPPRDHDPRNLNESATYIYDVLSKYGSPEYQEYDVGGITYKNVFLAIEGETEEAIVIGAHYDAYAGFPGADDNASGVAGILELARMFSEQRPPLSVVVVAYALEEPPYFGTTDMGSHHHAGLIAQSSPSPALMISLEMIGYFRNEAGSQSYPLEWLSHFYSESGNFIAIVGRLDEISMVRKIKSAFKGNTALPALSLTFFPVIPGMTFSDHDNYWIHGIDAVMITDTAFERNPNYHTESDTANTLDYTRMAQVVDGTFSAVWVLSRD